MPGSPQQMLTLPDGAGGHLYRQIHQRVRALILGGAWPPGTRLPSSRALARDLGVSRNTVILAFDQLVADGWAVARPGSGLFVADEAPPARARAAAGETATGAGPRKPVPFELSQSAVDLFPVARWRTIHNRLWRDTPEQAMYEGADAGWRPLQQAIAAYFNAVRGFACAPEQIIVLSSSQAAIDLAMRVLARRGDAIWVEDPGYLGARQAFQAHGLEQVAVAVDADGMDVAGGIARAPAARLAYVTPACQFPTCATLSPARRAALLDWARGAGAFVIEDDWDFNARFAGAAAPGPLAACGSDRVLFIHSFNRLLFPALRIAALVVPPGLVERFREARSAIDGFPTVANQIALAEFIDRGHLAAHLRACRTAFAERRAALHDGIARHFSGSLGLEASQPGLHGVAHMATGDDSALAAAARRHGVACVALNDFRMREPARPGALLLGFAAFAPEIIERSLWRLAQVLRGG